MSRPALLWPAWEEVARRLAASSRVALFSDFDGTLAPIASRPEQALLPPATRRVLKQLLRLPRVVLGIVSGRSLGDLCSQVRLNRIYYIGSHGLEWIGPHGCGGSPPRPRWVARIQKVRQELEAACRPLAGIYVERKPVSVAVHFRNAAPAAAARARQVVTRMVRQASGSLRLLEGKKIWELLPPGPMNKGRAVREVLTRIRRGSVRRIRLVYLGDDVTDESVFVRLRRGDVGIHVGARSRSRARYRLRSPAEVARFLERAWKVLA